MFIIGKFIRFGFFLTLLILIGDNVNQVSGYTLQQLITFFLFFNFFDIIGQLFFRGIYWFRQQIISGEFDFRLIKPINPLFAALTRQTDLLDLPLLFMITAYLVYQARLLPITTLALVLFLTILAFLIITAIHISVAALGILTTEVDHTIMIYRDVSSMARVPTDIYVLPIRFLITFILPIGIAYNFPAKAFLGILSFQFILLSILIAITFFFLSLRFWNHALTKYSSASS